MKSNLLLLIAFMNLFFSSTLAFTNVLTNTHLTTSTRRRAVQEPTKAEPTLEARKLKHNLLCQLKELKRLQQRDGDFTDIDWGTKGGELTETGRVPRTVDYSLISPEVG